MVLRLLHTKTLACEVSTHYVHIRHANFPKSEIGKMVVKNQNLRVESHKNIFGGRFNWQLWQKRLHLFPFNKKPWISDDVIHQLIARWPTARRLTEGKQQPLPLVLLNTLCTLLAIVKKSTWNCTVSAKFRKLGTPVYNRYCTLCCVTLHILSPLQPYPWSLHYTHG